MKIPLIYTIQFGECDRVSLELLKESPDKLLYKTTKYDYDIERNERCTLTLIMELRQLNDDEKQLALLHYATRSEKTEGESFKNKNENDERDTK